MQTLIFAAGIGLLAGLLVTGLSLWLFPRLGWLDFPERYGLARARLPYPGGVCLWLLALAGLSYFEPFRGLVLPVFILGVLSWWDDRRQLPASLRLMAHVWLALYMVNQGILIYYVSNPFADTNYPLAEALPTFAVGLSILWIVAIQNALNWFDGLPGLSVGISGVGFLTLAVLGVVKPELWFDTKHFDLTVLNFYLAALCAGAFWFYLKGRLVLGDTGSQVLGWLLAVMAIFSGAKIATTLIVLSLPLLDMAWVVFRRTVLQKKSPFKGDLFHLHHLLAARSDAQRVSLGLVGCSLVLGLSAVLLPADYKLLGFGAIAVAILSLNWWLWRGRKVC